MKNVRATNVEGRSFSLPSLRRSPHRRPARMSRWKTKQATVGSSYKAVFVVPHGCAGSATIKIRVQIPEGVIARQADAEGRLERRDDQGQIRQPNTTITAANCPKASRRWCGAAASCRTTITMNSSSAPFSPAA